MDLAEIKCYDDKYWLSFLKDRTIFDTDNIKAQKDWLISRVEKYELALHSLKNQFESNYVIEEIYEKNFHRVLYETIIEALNETNK